MTKDEALELALEALQKIYIAPEHEEYIRVWWPACEQAITAIKEVLAQEQEPVAYSGNGTAGREADVRPTGFFFQMPKRTTCPNGMVDTCCENYDDCTLRTWVGLTEEEKDKNT